MSDEFPSSTYQTQQQQVVISLEQHVDMDDLKKRSDDIRQLEVKDFDEKLLIPIKNHF